MIVEYHGVNKKVTLAEFNTMSLFFGGLLLSEKDIDRLQLTVSFSRDDAVAQWNGYTQQLGRHSYLIWIRPSKPSHTQIEVFAHEMVHVKQYMRRELCPKTGKILDPVMRSWAKRTTPGYYEDPSEIEAFGRTYGLVCRYYQQQKL